MSDTLVVGAARFCEVSRPERPHDAGPATPAVPLSQVWWRPGGGGATAPVVLCDMVHRLAIGLFARMRMLTKAPLLCFRW